MAILASMQYRAVIRSGAGYPALFVNDLLRNNHLASPSPCIHPSQTSLTIYPQGHWYPSNNSGKVKKDRWSLVSLFQRKPMGQDYIHINVSALKEDGGPSTADDDNTVGLDGVSIEEGKIASRVSMIASVSRLGVGSRVLVDAGDDGKGLLLLLQGILDTGCEQIVLANVSPELQSTVEETFNSMALWLGDVVELPLSYGLFDTILLNAISENVQRAEKRISSAAQFLKAGGRLLIGHLYGKAHLDPGTLPSESALKSIVAQLPLDLSSFQGNKVSYLAVLTRMSTYAAKDFVGEHFDDEVSDIKGPFWFPQAPLFLKGKVIAGFGRGSKKMGVPTANLNPEELSKDLAGVKNGVYLGWAQVIGDGIDRSIHKMVMNVGKRPTFADGDGLSVEVHVLASFEKDFYGAYVKVVALGNIRPEMKFGSVDELVKRIKLDIEITRAELDSSANQLYKRDPFFAS